MRRTVINYSTGKLRRTYKLMNNSEIHNQDKLPLLGKGVLLIGNDTAVLIGNDGSNGQRPGTVGFPGLFNALAPGLGEGFHNPILAEIPRCQQCGVKIGSISQIEPIFNSVKLAGEGFA